MTITITAFENSPDNTSVEPSIIELSNTKMLEHDKPWAKKP